MDLKDLRDLLKSKAGKQLRDFLVGHYIRLNSLESVKDLSNAQDQALELKATKKAVGVLEKILSEIISLEEYKEGGKLPEDKLYSL